jgi:hypothetical protein
LARTFTTLGRIQVIKLVGERALVTSQQGVVAGPISRRRLDVTIYFGQISEYGCWHVQRLSWRRDLTLETGSEHVTLAESLAVISTSSPISLRMNDPGSMASLQDYCEERRFQNYFYRKRAPSSIKEGSNPSKSGGRLVLDRRLLAITSLVILPLPLRTSLSFRTIQIIQLRFQVLLFSTLSCQENLSASSSSRADGSSAVPSHLV